MYPEVYEAAKSGEFHSLMTIILENGEDLSHQTTPKGNNVLHVAAQFGRANFIREFLQDLPRSSLLWKCNCKGDTPLHVATQLGSYEMLLRIPNSDEDTLLHSVIRRHCKGVVELLIEEDPHLCDIINAADESPLYLAIHQRLWDIIEPILCASSWPSSHKGPKGLTALHAAVTLSLSSCKKILEKRPEMIREKDDIGWTPLHYVAHANKVDAVQLLLQHDTSIAYDLDKEGDSALHIAALQGHINVINQLITSCHDAWDIINFKRQTALHAAVIGGKVNVVKHILRITNLEDLINKKDTNGNMALHLAMHLREYDSALILAKDKRVDCFATTKDHLTALDIFSAQKDEDSAGNFICHRWILSEKSEGLCQYNHSSRVLRALKDSHGFPTVQDRVVEEKRRLEKQFSEGQSAASITMGRDSSLKSLIELELLVASFIATATFAAAFAIPGGYSNDGPNQGMATLAGRAAFKTFVITNTIALVFVW
ncbi:hypothetical protein EUGRSUZ_D01529 [Eucalyptus grandis]|uniref:PGG domain-containing protein n=2 Tax=Eucalyptus grandis TaxID=71139 RepID=A0A059CFM5_EUCGR|nr:hypothetical protein EUGRSUZ_D01529 [Eucalyptus grandis]